MTKNKFIQGLYKPKHPEKYIGDVNRIIFRSSWELKFNQFLDNNPNILEWGSEVIAIPYIKPTDGKIHKYYVDYFIRYIDNNKNERIELIEIKPAVQTRYSRSKNPNIKLYETINLEINKAKWEAAEKFAKARGWTFRVITEQQLFK